ncbi:hypothetical protein [Streptomyces sp. NPDC001820]|uniref:hypothetical protein n=1 Tax=Streptomyces sp. NPDC001820 TaxID=3364613 RepID=UPI0036A801EE
MGHLERCRRRGGNPDRSACPSQADGYQGARIVIDHGRLLTVTFGRPGVVELLLGN